MSDTPRTDDERGFCDDSGCWKSKAYGECVRDDFVCDLERELNAANERIRRLEEAVDTAIRYCEFYGPVGAAPDTTKLLLKELRKAKENKL